MDLPRCRWRTCGVGKGGSVKAMEWLLGSAGGPGGGTGSHSGSGTGSRTGSGTAGGAGGGARAAAGVAAVGLAAAGALHVVWTVSPWPLATRAEFAAAVVGVGESRLPSTPETLAVAGLLGAGAWLTVTAARPAHRLAPSRLVRTGLWTLSGVLAARGLGGLLVSGLDLREVPAEFRHWDLALYSPLCLALGGLTGYLAVRTRPGNHPDPRSGKAA
ncbi:DUF3995 domain-containing protein [Streptomyces yaizuensis]|uniref:DUF3995 domain-containing protein n=1 Tax=Streptomyces yaizuensis TaxID=2989713 RepID=A0ABQ5P9C8_9ACTN|nr:DUF3995 domain-containing protein [Streptomyces sp. YSPA8]GLF99184.1 hypothetical protein SYYSPA8_32825 [Streptomyces sp. YSPA8]